MEVTFEIIKKYGPNGWEPYDGKGIVEMKPLLNINHGGQDLVFIVQLDDRNFDVVCDGRTMVAEPESKNGFINKKFKGTCIPKNDPLNQTKVLVSFGDFPNSNAVLAITSTDQKEYYSGTSHYLMKIINQVL